MNTLKNKVQLIGNLGQDPEIKTSANGKTYAKFTLGTNEIYKNQAGEKVTDTQWHNVIVWGKLAEIAEKYLSKGDRIYVEGRIKTRKWTDDKGIERYSTEIQCTDFTSLTTKKDSQDVSNQASPASNTSNSSNEQPDDLPF